MKPLKLHLILILFFAATFNISAQNNTAAEAEKPYIEVTGTAEKEVIPDEIFIAINLRERYAGREKITIEAQEEKLKTGLKEIGVDLANLSLSDANAIYIRAKLFTKDVMAKKEYILKVSDAVTVGKVFEVLEKNEISDARISKVNHSKIETLRKEVRIMAIKAAKEKADYLLAAIGEQTGKALIVQEKEILQGNTYRNMNQVANVSTGYYIQDKSKLGSFIGEEIEFQKINIRFAIYVKFAIK